MLLLSIVRHENEIYPQVQSLSELFYLQHVNVKNKNEINQMFLFLSDLRFVYLFYLPWNDPLRFEQVKK